MGKREGNGEGIDEKNHELMVEIKGTFFGIPKIGAIFDILLISGGEEGEEGF